MSSGLTTSMQFSWTIARLSPDQQSDYICRYGADSRMLNMNSVDPCRRCCFWSLKQLHQNKLRRYGSTLFKNEVPLQGKFNRHIQVM